MGFQVLSTDELRALGPEAYGDRCGAPRAAPSFLSFDVDFVDPAYTPGTGTPEVAGPTSGEAISFVRALQGSIVGADVVEVAPAYDGPGQATCSPGHRRLGATGAQGCGW